MTEQEPRQNGETTAALLAAAEAHYQDMIVDFLALKQRVRERNDLSETEIRRVIVGFGRAIQTLFDERKKVEQQAERESGALATGEIDFDAARAEIGRRLARLRDPERTG